MKKALLIIGIVIFVMALVIVAICVGLIYHARMTATDWGGMENPDWSINEHSGDHVPDTDSEAGADIHMLDGDYSYVDNEALLQRIVGNWISEDGTYSMTYDENYHMTIIESGVEVFSATADFTYLQPGEVTATDFNLDTITVKDTLGNDFWEVDYCYHGLEDGEDVIYLYMYPIAVLDGGEDVVCLKFKKE